MITRLDTSSGSAVGYRFSGAIDKADYAVLVPEMEKLVADHGDVQLLCDLSEFTSEKLSAWPADLHFGKEFHTSISKMAIVGPHHWEKWIAKAAGPFYAREVRYFPEADEAWTWLRAG
ncbi:MAG: STAS/SEC14 domain-containing protein [Actinomycetia bacterium]|nr:STAS/SEC14 domain-containing protein [Actinomycetes bacterium]